MLEKELYIEIDRPNYTPIYSVQYDYNSRFYNITILNQSQPLDLTGLRVVVAGKKPDGEDVFNSCKILDAKKGQIQLELTEQMNTVTGVSEYALELFSSNGMLSSQPFQLKITKSTISKDVASSSELSALQNALNEVQDIDNRFAQTNAQLSEIKEHCTGGNGMQEHSHVNKGVLDKFNESNSKLLYDEKPISYFIEDESITTNKLKSHSVTQEKIHPDVKLGVQINDSSKSGFETWSANKIDKELYLMHNSLLSNDDKFNLDKKEVVIEPNVMTYINSSLDYLPFTLFGKSYISDGSIMTSSEFEIEKQLYKTTIISAPRRAENDITPQQWFKSGLNETTGEPQERDGSVHSSEIYCEYDDSIYLYFNEYIDYISQLAILQYDEAGGFLGITRYANTTIQGKDYVIFNVSKENTKYCKLLISYQKKFYSINTIPKITIGRNTMIVEDQVNYTEYINIYHSKPMYSVNSGYCNKISNCKFIEELGSFVLNGTDSDEKWSVQENNISKNTILFKIYPIQNLDKFKDYNFVSVIDNFQVDKYTVVLGNTTINNNDEECIGFESNSIKLRLNKNKFSSTESSSNIINELKLLLSADPITVVSLLKEPKIEAVSNQKIPVCKYGSEITAPYEMLLYNVPKGTDLTSEEYGQESINSLRDRGANYLKVVSYNTWGLKEKKEIGEYCVLNQVDYIGMQEVAGSEGELSILSKYSFKNIAYSPAINTSSRTSGTACMTRKNIIEQQNISLPVTGGAEPRSVGRIVTYHNGKKIAFYNTHLSYEGVGSDRVAQAQHIIDKINEYNDEYVIITGDFNDYDREGHPVFKFFQANGYKLCNDVFGDKIITFPSTGTAIDNVIVSSNIEILDCYTDDSYLKKSDHKCLVAELMLL